MTEVLQREIRHSLVPMVLEESTRGERAFDIYSMLLRQRIVFLGQEVDEENRLVYRWATFADAPSRVAIELTPTLEGTRITISESPIEVRAQSSLVLR